MRGKVAVKSSIIGLIAQIVTMAMAFVCTEVFFRYLGVEMKGINGVFENCLSMLQLAEMGIGTAIIYALYQPIVENNILEIQILMQFYKKVYRIIGIAVFLMGFIMSFFIDFFVEDTTRSKEYLVFVFYIQLIATVSSYFLAYRRNLLYADQKQYVTTIVDALCNCAGTLLRMLVIVVFQSYIAYICISVLQTVVSNVIISQWCAKQYPFLKEKVNQKYDKMDQLVVNVKNLLMGRIGGYVYSSTDQLIISKMVGVTAVGYMAGYYQVANIFKRIATSITAPIQPMIGNYIRADKGKEQVYNLFLNYTFIRYIIANWITVGMVVMTQPFIVLWLGEEFLLPQLIPVLLAADIFISVVHGPAVEFISVLGLFKNDRNLSFGGASINLILSIILAKYIGVSGVLIGTVIAQIYYWSMRGRIVFENYFQGGVWRYIGKVGSYIMLTVIEIVICQFIYNRFFSVGGIGAFVCMVIICLCVSTGLTIICFYRTCEFKMTMELVKTGLHRNKA